MPRIYLLPAADITKLTNYTSVKWDIYWQIIMIMLLFFHFLTFSKGRCISQSKGQVAVCFFLLKQKKNIFLLSSVGSLAGFFCWKCHPAKRKTSMHCSMLFYRVVKFVWKFSTPFLVRVLPIFMILYFSPPRFMSSTNTVQKKRPTDGVNRWAMR